MKTTNSVHPSSAARRSVWAAVVAIALFGTVSLAGAVGYPFATILEEDVRSRADLSVCEARRVQVRGDMIYELPVTEGILTELQSTLEAGEEPRIELQTEAVLITVGDARARYRSRVHAERIGEDGRKKKLHGERSAENEAGFYVDDVIIGLSEDDVSDLEAGDTFEIRVRGRTVAKVRDCDGSEAEASFGLLTRPTLVLAPQYGSVEATLPEGGTMVGPGGARLAATPGLPTSDVSVTLSQVDAPVESAFPGSTPIGRYYEIEASADVVGTADQSFTLTLPIPAGTPVDNLAVATLQSAAPARLELENGAEALWVPMLATLSADGTGLEVALRGIGPDPQTLVVISHPDLAPFAPVGVAAAASAKGPTARAATAAGNDFLVQCLNYDLLPFQTCSEAAEIGVENMLTNIYYPHFKGFGFGDPALPSLSTAGRKTFFNVFLVHEFFCSTESGGVYTGVYMDRAQVIWICMPNDPDPSDVHIPTLKHELFHAIQSGYPAIGTKPYDEWMIEGHATAAEESAVKMVRTKDFNMRVIETPMDSKAGVDGYMAQDFWVYLGHQNDKDGKQGDLGYLAQFYQQGPLTQDVVDTLGATDFKDAFWRYAKNFTMVEEGFDYRGALNPHCELQTSRAPFRPVVSRGSPQWDTTKMGTGTMPPLMGAVIEVQLPANDEGQDIVVSTLDPDTNPDLHPDLRFKFYKDGEGCTGTERVFGDPSTEVLSVPPGETGTWYILVSNPSHTDSMDFMVSLSEVDSCGAGGCPSLDLCVLNPDLCGPDGLIGHLPPPPPFFP